MDKCEHSPILGSFIEAHFPQHLAMFQKKIGINYCLASKDITFCPREKCEMFCRKPDTLTVDKVECQCGNVYCFYCRKPAHMPLKCESVTKWERYVNKEEKNSEWIINNTTICPQCRMNVEKSIGCNYIKCVCGCEFCYACSGYWDDFHKGGRSCPERNMQSEGENSKGSFNKTYELVLNAT